MLFKTQAERFHPWNISCFGIFFYLLLWFYPFKIFPHPHIRTINKKKICLASLGEVEVEEEENKVGGSELLEDVRIVSQSRQIKMEGVCPSGHQQRSQA